jgi:3-deoxy-D-manno-octulosonate 8-phosphate phosphatase (KDO 8-P phosphatase)
MAEMDYGKIELLVLDVDGVLTDGHIVLTPDGDEIKCFSVRDGSGLKYWQRVGKRAAIISGRGSPAVSIRAKELGIDPVRLKVHHKGPALAELMDELSLNREQVAVMGDDLTDLPMLMSCGLAIAPSDAVSEVRRRAHLVTRRPGGAGCVREAIEFILHRAGLWDAVMQRYLPDEQDAPT